MRVRHTTIITKSSLKFSLTDFCNQTRKLLGRYYFGEMTGMYLIFSIKLLISRVRINGGSFSGLPIWLKDHHLKKLLPTYMHICVLPVRLWWHDDDPRATTEASLQKQREIKLRKVVDLEQSLQPVFSELPPHTHHSSVQDHNVKLPGEEKKRIKGKTRRKQVSDWKRLPLWRLLPSVRKENSVLRTCAYWCQ